MRTITPLTLLAYLGAITRGTATPIPIANRSTTLAGRSYSVKTTQELRSSGLLNHALISPWPMTYERTVIPYCFLDQSSATSLSELVVHAVAQWWPAFQYSSLFIAPACKTRSKGREQYDYKCICGPQKDGSKTPKDALVIDDVRFGSKDKTKWETDVETQIGYDQVAKKQILRYGAVNDEALGDLPQQEKQDELVSHLVHELGHAIGLLHEHQRTDRDQYVTFTPKNMDTYPDFKENVKDDSFVHEQLGPKPPSRKKLKALALSTYKYAEVFFPKVTDYIMIDSIEKSDIHPFLDVSGGPFDYGSIMIYSSFDSMRYPDNEKTKRKLRYPLLRGPSGEPEGPKGRIIPDRKCTGPGSAYTGARISTQDVVRVAKLYPGSKQQQNAVSELQGTKTWKPVRITAPAWLRNPVIEPNPVDLAIMVDGKIKYIGEGGADDGNKCGSGRHSPTQEAGGDMITAEVKTGASGEGSGT